MNCWASERNHRAKGLCTACYRRERCIASVAQWRVVDHSGAGGSESRVVDNRGERLFGPDSAYLCEAFISLTTQECQSEFDEYGEHGRKMRGDPKDVFDFGAELEMEIRFLADRLGLGRKRLFIGSADHFRAMSGKDQVIMYFFLGRIREELPRRSNEAAMRVLREISELRRPPSQGS